MVLEDENQLLFFSNGMTINLMSNGVISFDSSGQVRNYHELALINMDIMMEMSNCCTKH